MASAAQIQEWFDHAVETAQYDDAFRDLAMSATSKLEQMPKPGPKDEAWRYNDLNLIFKHKYKYPKDHLVDLSGLKEYIRSDCSNAYLVSVLVLLQFVGWEAHNTLGIRGWNLLSGPQQPFCSS
jgi:hypothetical protein